MVLDAITRQGKIAIADFRGQKPVLVGLFRGLHCPFCRRQIAAMAELTDALQEKGIDSLTVVNTPIERAPRSISATIRFQICWPLPIRIGYRTEPSACPTCNLPSEETDWPTSCQYR